MKHTAFKNTFLATLLLLAFTGSAYAAKQYDTVAPEGFDVVKTQQLDQAWVNPQFEPNDYDTVVIQWGDFDYKPAKKFHRTHRDLDGHFDMADWAKVKMKNNAYAAFANKLANADHFQLVDIEGADARTMGVKLRITDIVNKVPDTLGVGGRYEVYLRDFGAMTLNVEFINQTTQELLFKGQVRDTIDARGFDFERATPFIAVNRIKWKFNRWATGLEKGLDNMK